MVLGATTLREFVEVLGSSTEESEVRDAGLTCTGPEPTLGR